MSKSKAKLHILDVAPRDIDSAITRLEELNRTGQLAGLLFVAKVKGKKKPIMGAAGCCVSDRMAAMGAAVHLLRAITDIAVNE